MIKRFRCFAGMVAVFALPVLVLAQNSQECYPSCRPGFVCHNGNCISKCNPACPDGQKCTDSGDCIPLTKPETASSKQPKEIHCAAVFVVRPEMNAANVPGNFEKSEFLNASNMLAIEITKKISPNSAIISSEDIDAIQNCNGEMIVVKVITYYKKPAAMGQSAGVLTISISNYDSPHQKTPVRTQQFTAEGDRHWGDSVPLQNAVDEVCKQIRGKYKP